jgi:Nuclease-related domain
MRKIKGSSNYLRNQVRKNFAKAVFSALIFAVVFVLLIFRILSTLQVDILEVVGLVFLFGLLVAFYFYLRKYHIYRGGWQGEKEVTALLSHTLSDDFFLLNDLYLREGGGDIDHIVLGPNGVFVLETKNWNGSISCDGDEWKRVGKRNFSGSPSRQVKRNTSKIRQIINTNPNLRVLDILVEGIVIFTNNRAILHLNCPTVPILKLPQLPNYLTNHGKTRSLSPEQIEAIGTEIVKEKN